MCLIDTDICIICTPSTYTCIMDTCTIDTCIIDNYIIDRSLGALRAPLKESLMQEYIMLHT